MPSKLDLINRTLSEIGKPSVTVDDESEASIYIAAKIDELHPELLLAFEWPFAIVYRRDSTPLVSNYTPDFTYTYQLPANFGRFFRFSPQSGQNGYYAFVDGLLLSNLNPVQYYYIANDVSYDVLPPIYTRMLVLYAASQSALFLTQNVQLTGYLDKKYKEKKIEAILQANMEASTGSAPYNEYNRINFV